MKILYIALEFAPVQTTGAFRSIEFVRRLPEHGITPCVVTLRPEDGMRIFSAPLNAELLNGLPEDASRLELSDAKAVDPQSETPLASLFRLYTNLDDSFFYRFRGSLDAHMRARKLTETIDAVVASAPPFGATKLGMLAASRLNCPLILDMRDSWAELGFAPSPTSLHYRAKRRDESLAFGAAARVVTVTQRLAEVFRSAHPSLSRQRFDVVANGFPGHEFEGHTIKACSKEVVEVAYVGSFYFSPEKPASLLRPQRYLQHRLKTEDWSYRGPQYFFAAWRALIDREPELGRRIRFNHIGNAPAFLMTMAADYGLADYCKLWGVVPKQEVGEILSKMDAMLATSMKRDDGGDYCLASKTFDYVEARKPVLAFVCEGSQRDFLQRAGIGVICDPDDIDGSAATMARLVREGVSLELNADYVNQFHRREAARRMAGVIYDVTGRPRPDSVQAADTDLEYI